METDILLFFLILMRKVQSELWGKDYFKNNVKYGYKNLATNKCIIMSYLQSRTDIWKFSNPVEYVVDHFFPNRVVTTGIVVGRVFLARDELLWMKELPVSSSPNLVNNRLFQIDKHRPGNVLSTASLRKESGQVAIVGESSHRAVGVNSML